MAGLPPEPPGWVEGGLVGWNEYNPFFHLWNWGVDKRFEGAQAELLEAETKLQLANALMGGICSMPLADWNASVERTHPMIKEIADAFGKTGIAEWYPFDTQGKMTEEQYQKIRSEIAGRGGVDLLDGTHLSCVPVTAPPYTPPTPESLGAPPVASPVAQTGIMSKIMASPASVFGGALILGGAALGIGYMLLKPKKKTRRKTRRKRLR